MTTTFPVPPIPAEAFAVPPTPALAYAVPPVPAREFALGQVGAVPPEPEPEPVLWTPADLDNVALWFDAADADTITVTGSGVSEWRDKSGGAVHVTQSADARRPVYDPTEMGGRGALMWPNDQNAVGFEGRTLSPVISPTVCFFVARYDGPSPFAQYSGGLTFNYNAAPDLPILTDNGSIEFYISLDGMKAINGDEVGTLSVLPIIQSPFMARTIATVSPNRSTLFVGIDRGFAGRGWMGGIFEIVILRDEVSLETRQMTEGYLMHKWGLADSLPADHPYKAAAP